MKKTELKDYVDVSEEVAHALENNIPIVALESTIIAQSPPYPQNVERALEAERIVRSGDCVPATMAIIKGRLKIGLTKEEIDYIGSTFAPKVSRRDLAPTIALERDGATTVTTTMILAGLVVIKVFATGGIGGVHRGFEEIMDVSGDLDELGRHNMIVVCSGPKAILDQKRTLEYLETKGVSVVGWKTSELPGFYTRTTGLKVDYQIDDAKTAVKILQANEALGNTTATVLCNPVPLEYAMDQKEVDDALAQALVLAKEKNITGKQVTPFLLGVIKDVTKGANRVTNKQLVYDNVRVATLVAAASK
jgi:pseudouridine-5'-phosphate glycosidase